MNQFKQIEVWRFRSHDWTKKLQLSGLLWLSSGHCLGHPASVWTTVSQFYLDIGVNGKEASLKGKYKFQSERSAAELRGNSKQEVTHQCVSVSHRHFMDQRGAKGLTEPFKIFWQKCIKSKLRCRKNEYGVKTFDKYFNRSIICVSSTAKPS